MLLDPFEIIGIWKLTSERSEELLCFKPDGTYRIYYEVPFRVIELGQWQILKNRLILFCNNTQVSCKINFLNNHKMEFSHLCELKKTIKDKYIKINTI